MYEVKPNAGRQSINPVRSRLMEEMPSSHSFVPQGKVTSINGATGMCHPQGWVWNLKGP